VALTPAKASSDRHRYLVDVREGPRVVLVAERHAPAEATFTFDEITALPPRIAARIGFPSIG
jgi:hypothetical protein